MSSRTNIVDGTGQGYVARVDQFNTLWVRDFGIPPTSDPNNPAGALLFNDIQTVYREFLTRDGDGVTTDARVSGSLASPVNFYVSAEQNVDIYITSIAISVGASGQQLDDFGGTSGGLTNGLKFFYQGVNGDIIIGNNIKSCFDVVRLCQGNPAFTDPSAGPFIAANVLGATEGLFQVLDLRKVFGLPYGVRLNTGSVNKLVMQVRDIIVTTGPTPTTFFDAIAYGTRVKLI